MPSAELYPGDAFDRALKLTFGVQASAIKVKQARILYARYRTDEMLERLKATAVDKKPGDNASKF